MVKRIAAIALVFVATCIGWSILGATIKSRTNESDPRLREKVTDTWGAPQHVRPPIAVWLSAASAAEGKPVRLLQTRAKADIDLEHRQRGLLWFNTYRVRFESTYEFQPPMEAGYVTLAWEFPSKSAVYDDVSVAINGSNAPITPNRDSIWGQIPVTPGQPLQVKVAYTSQGVDQWEYAFGDANVSPAEDFRLLVNTNFDNYDVADGSLSPTQKDPTDRGWSLTWKYKNLISGFPVRILMPNRLQPGPLVGEISQFAPVSLLLFFFVMLVLTTINDIELHPVNYFFLAAAFFAFHLLLAYLVDHVSLQLSFLLASFVSVGLAATYLRLVVNDEFAIRKAAVAQLVYLVLFSYAFFFEGFTGLTITVLSIATLYVTMQMTGRIRWAEKFAQRPLTAPTSAAGPSPAHVA